MTLLKSISLEPVVKKIQIKRAGLVERVPIFKMLELYQYELSDIWDQDIDEHGEYGYNLDRFWNDKKCFPFIVLIEGHYAGFALVDAYVKVGASGYWMDQFFILKKYRKRGVGRALAFDVFSQMSGKWEVGQMTENVAAQAFRRRVINQYSHGRYKEILLTEGWWQGVIQTFESQPVDNRAKAMSSN